MPKKNVIFAASNDKCGDFLLNHWLGSLKDNVDLKNMDIVILDYGLTKNQREGLIKEGAIIYTGSKTGLIHNMRFKDMADFLKNKNYDQVITTDGGDVIFQTDIKELLETKKDKYRAHCEDLDIPFTSLYLKKSFDKKTAEMIGNTLKNKKTINAGVIVAPADKFRNMCLELFDLMSNQLQFGADQLGINYIMYRDSFYEVDERYNFVITTTKKKFYIKEGVFYDEDDKKIPIVHNVGGRALLRSIKNFGYGKDYNKLKKHIYYGGRTIFFLIGIVRKIKKKIIRS